MKIEKISAQPDMVGRYKTVLSDGTVLRLYKQTVQDFGLYPEMELEDETLQKLQTAASEMSAKMRAVRMVSASSVSKRELEHRLIQKGENATHARQAVSWLSDMQLLDDGQTARQIVERCIGKGYGMARAKQVLYEKRIPKEFWEQALTDYPDMGEEIRRYIRTHLPEEPDQKSLKKVIDALLRRGHSYQAIRRELEVAEPWEE